MRILTGKLAGTYTPSGEGKFFFTMMAAFAELERDIIHERTMAWLTAARAQGCTGGRAHRVMSADKLAAAPPGTRAARAPPRSPRPSASPAPPSTATSPLPQAGNRCKISNLTPGRTVLTNALPLRTLPRTPPSSSASPTADRGPRIWTSDRMSGSSMRRASSRATGFTARRGGRPAGNGHRRG